MVIAVLVAISLTGCGPSREERARAAAEKRAYANAVEAALAATRNIPKMPEECRREERAGAREGELQAVTITKYDIALDRANQKLTYCADWHDNLRGD